MKTSAELREIASILEKGAGNQSCPECDKNSAVFVRCGRGDCFAEHTMRQIAAAALTEVAEERELAALREQGEPVAWIPVSERLPKLEVRVIAYYKNDLGKDRRIRAFYAPKFSMRDVENYEGDADYNETEDEYYWPEGWYECNEHEETNWRVDGEITHWMPLPSAPGTYTAPQPDKWNEALEVAKLADRTIKLERAIHLMRKAGSIISATRPEAFKDWSCGENYPYEIANAIAVFDGDYDPAIRTLKQQPAPSMVQWEPTDEQLEIGRKAVEDLLIEWRDSRLSELRNNGLVIKEKDGTASSIIRFGTETALKVGIKAMLAASESEVKVKS